MEENTLSVYKGYLRQLLRRLKELKEANDTGDHEKATRIIQELIEDTQNNIED